MVTEGHGVDTESHIEKIFLMVCIPRWSSVYPPWLSVDERAPKKFGVK
jgi:hypothetical protein